MNSAKILFEVTAAVLPGHPEPEHTRTWVIESERWASMGVAAQAEELARMCGESQGYAMLLGLQPDRFNEVVWRWIYL